MRKFLEYFDELDQIEYPLKCRVIGYRVKFGDSLLCGSFVLPRNRKQETRSLGFNVTTPYYGYGSMIDTKKALVFLTRADAQNFCEKYVPRYVNSISVYPANVLDILVRIDENLDIPVYMSQAAVNHQDRVKLSTTAINATDAEMTSFDAISNWLSSELTDKMKKTLKKREKRDLIASFMPAIRSALQDLGPVSIDTPLGEIRYSVELLCRNITNQRYEIDITVCPQILFGKQQSEDLNELLIYPRTHIYAYDDVWNLMRQYNNVPRSENAYLDNMLGRELIFALAHYSAAGSIADPHPLIYFEVTRQFTPRSILRLDCFDIYTTLKGRFGEVTQNNFVQEMINRANEIIPAFNQQLLKSVDHMQDVAEENQEAENGDEIVRLTYADFQ